jgi:hypothetical protein
MRPYALDNLLDTAAPVKAEGPYPNLTPLMAKYGITKAGYSIDEAKKNIPCGDTKIYELIGDRRLKAVKLGKRTIVLGYSIALLLDSLEREGCKLRQSPNPRAPRTVVTQPGPPELDDVG